MGPNLIIKGGGGVCVTKKRVFVLLARLKVIGEFDIAPVIIANRWDGYMPVDVVLIIVRDPLLKVRRGVEPVLLIGED